MSQDIVFESAAGLQRRLRARELSPREALDALADRIVAVDPSIGGYLSYELEAARLLADQADVNLPLGGVPIAVKDAICVKDQPCNSGSKILGNFRSPYDATVIARLRAAGAIPFGRANMDEFAMGSSTENSGLATTRNPWDTSRVPGGSSGGSAALVASRTAFAALGSDTGGSIRQPAALCGVVGLKPSYGRVSRYGLVAFASSLDQIGPITRTVEDAALILGVMAGGDPHDSTSLDEPVPDYVGALADQSLKGLRVGLPKEYFISGIDPQVEASIRAAVEHLTGLGAEIVDISLPHTQYAVAVYYIIATAEASANLARFDGVRYGHRAKDTTSLLDFYGRTRDEGFGPEVKRRIILGTYVLSSGYHDAYYLQAQKVRTLLRKDFEQAFQQCDVIVSPTSPVPAFPLGERTQDPLAMYLADIFTIAANLGGVCGVSIPCGFAQPAEPGGRELPIGMQLLGPFFDEVRLLRVAHAYEQSTDWHTRRPPL